MVAKEAMAAKETITAKMSRWAAGLEYKQLSQDAVYQAKRFLLDSVGCALGGYQQHDVKIALEVLDEIAGRGSSTVIGTGKRIDPVSASLANDLVEAVRCHPERIAAAQLNFLTHPKPMRGHAHLH